MSLLTSIIKVNFIGSMEYVGLYYLFSFYEYMSESEFAYKIMLKICVIMSSSWIIKMFSELKLLGCDVYESYFYTLLFICDAFK